VSNEEPLLDDDVGRSSFLRSALSRTPTSAPPVHRTGATVTNSARRAARIEEGDDGVDDEVLVRAYALTGGRTSADPSIQFETMVQASSAPRPALAPHVVELLKLIAREPLSIAELAAHLNVPIGVVRVTVSDLLAGELVVANAGVGGAETVEDRRPQSRLDLLKQVIARVEQL
jgi:predicted transcriptional regulator